MSGADAGAGASGSPIVVKVNGEPAELRAGTTVAAIVAAAGVAPDARGVAVAVDGEVVRRAEWATTVLREGQRVELLTAVAGG